MAATPKKKATAGQGVNYNNNLKLDAAFAREACRGRVRYVHESMGLIIPPNHKKHTPCQGCHGKDRFRIFDDYEETGSWICSGGGNRQGGDLFSLPMHVFGWTFLDTLKRIYEILGLYELNPNERQRMKARSEKAKAQAQHAAIKKTHLANQDCYLLDVIFNHEFALKERQGLKSLEPTSLELLTAASLVGAIESAYPQLKEVA